MTCVDFVDRTHHNSHLTLGVGSLKTKVVTAREEFYLFVHSFLQIGRASCRERV